MILERDIMTTEQKPLISKQYRLLAGMGAMAFWWTSNLRNYFGAFFITDILLLPASTYAIAGTMQSILGFFIAPLIGAIVDNGLQGKFGKYRKWLLIGPILHSIAFVLCFLPVSTNVAVMTVYISITWCLNTITHTLVYTPYYTLHAIISRTPGERTGFVSKRNFWVNVAKLIYSNTYIVVIAFFGSLLGGEVWGYTGTAIVIAILNILMFYGEFLGIGNAEKKLLEEKGITEASTTSAAAKKGPGVMDIIRNIGTNLPFGLVCFNQFGFGFCSSIRSAIYVYYYNNVIGNPEMYALHLTLASLMGISATLTLPHLAKRFENKKIAAYSFSSQVVFALLMRIFMLKQPIVGLVFSMCFEFCSITNGSIVASMFQDTAVYAEWKTGVNSMGSVIGSSQIVGRIAGLITPAIIAAVLSASGYTPGEAVSETAAATFVNAICYLPMVVCAISATAAFLNPLTNKKLMQYQQEIAARK